MSRAYRYERPGRALLPNAYCWRDHNFATRMEIPFNLPSGQQKLEDFQAASRGFLLKSMGISHTHDTKVGNEFVGGVSGGDENQSASSKPSQPEEEERVLLRQQQPWSGCKHSSGVHQNHPRLDGHFLSRLCSHVIPSWKWDLQSLR
jgi:hypothetical protein